MTSYKEERLYVRKYYKSLNDFRKFVNLYKLSLARLRAIAWYINEKKECILISNINSYDEVRLISKIRQALDNTYTPDKMWGLTSDDWFERAVGHPEESWVIECLWRYKEYSLHPVSELRNWTTYIGRENIKDCLTLVKWLEDKKLCKAVGYRKAKRVKGCKFELKVWGLKQEVIEVLTKKELERQSKLKLIYPTLKLLPSLPEVPKHFEWEIVCEKDAIRFKEIAEAIEIAKQENMPDMAQEFQDELDKAEILIKEGIVYRKSKVKQTG